MEACSCHPLDTIKVRMQLLRSDPHVSDIPRQPRSLRESMADCWSSVADTGRICQYAGAHRAQRGSCWALQRLRCRRSRNGPQDGYSVYLV